MPKETSQISVFKKDKLIFNNLTKKYDTDQKKLFCAMVKVMKYFDPELKHDLK